jgi:hypothetical protein
MSVWEVKQKFCTGYPSLRVLLDEQRIKVRYMAVKYFACSAVILPPENRIFNTQAGGSSESWVEKVRLHWHMQARGIIFFSVTESYIIFLQIVA